MQLTEQLAVAQRRLAHYETGRLQLLVSWLVKLADALDEQAGDLIGVQPGRSAQEVRATEEDSATARTDRSLARSQATRR